MRSLTTRRMTVELTNVAAEMRAGSAVDVPHEGALGLTLTAGD